MSQATLKKLAMICDAHCNEWLLQDGEFMVLEQMAFSIGEWHKVDGIRSLAFILGY